MNVNYRDALQKNDVTRGVPQAERARKQFIVHFVQGGNTGTFSASTKEFWLDVLHNTNNVCQAR